MKFLKDIAWNKVGSILTFLDKQKHLLLSSLYIGIFLTRLQCASIFLLLFAREHASIYYSLCKVI